MVRTKARFFTTGAILALTALVVSFGWPAAQAQQIRGQLSNFDAHNENDEEMTNLELDLRNIVPTEILSYYDGDNAWGVPPLIRDISGTEVTWADFRQPIPPGGQQHFGLELRPDAPFPCGAQAYWTQHVKVVEVPVPWQTWRPEPGMLIDVIQLNPEFPEPVVIVWQSVVWPERIPLDFLNWDEVGFLPWGPEVSMVISPGEIVELPVPLDDLLSGGAYVRYTVALERNPENVITRFVNEAEFEMFAFEPTILFTLSNFDVHNDTGKPVHDFELDLYGLDDPSVIDGWYQGSNAWGLHPVTNDPAIGTIPGGIEVNWVDEWNPLQYCETRHFGLRFVPGTPPPVVRAFWTRVVKVRQIPVPWQWWQTPGGDVVTDVIQLSDTFDEPVFIEREWAVSTFPIPLDGLTWDNPFISWQSDPAGPVLLDPGDQTFLDIQVEPGDQAVLVRYTASRVGATDAETRFVNEALVTSAVEPLTITGSLSNFDVTNNTNLSFTNLELDLRTIQPWHIIDWYKGNLAWGLHPVDQSPIIDPLPQTEVMWSDFRDPLPHCQTRHFGIELISDAPPPCGVQAYWTQHLKVVEIPVPWQTWRPGPDMITDVIRLSFDFPEPVVIQREWAVTPFRLSLDELFWDNPAIPWIPVSGDPSVLFPGDTLELPIPLFLPDAQAAFVRYTVALESNPENVITRFTNEAWIEQIGPTRQPPAIVGELSNFDVHNDTGKPVYDLELDIRNINPDQILGWYTGPDAWGIDPVIREFPDGSGTEVTWIDERNPIHYCETRHFGLFIDPTAPEPWVRAFWTRPVKVAQIPVPWQFWLVPNGPFIRDVVQLSDTFTQPVTIRRDFAVVDTPVPLNDLNWDLVALWQPDPAGPILLQPGFQADLDIEVDENSDAAVLVRYDVQSPLSPTVITRFVNEAILGPGLVSGLIFPDDDKAYMEWNRSLVRDAVYDVISGNIRDIRTTGGVQWAFCLQNDVPVPSYSHPVSPLPDRGYYYLVRSQTLDGQSGSYDTTTDPLLREGRDAEVASGGGDCP